MQTTGSPNHGFRNTRVFISVFDSFQTFWVPGVPGAFRPREPFSRLCSDFGLKGPNDPCQQVLNPTPLNPTPTTCHKRNFKFQKQKLSCNFRKVALQKLHCNIPFSAVRTSFLPKAALQQTKSCAAKLKRLRCKKVALSLPLSCGFQAPTFSLRFRSCCPL